MRLHCSSHVSLARPDTQPYSHERDLKLLERLNDVVALLPQAPELTALLMDPASSLGQRKVEEGGRKR